MLVEELVVWAVIAVALVLVAAIFWRGDGAPKVDTSKPFASADPFEKWKDRDPEAVTFERPMIENRPPTEAA